MTETIDKTIRTPTEFPHIERDYQGRPVIKGTRMRVSMIVQITNGIEPLTPEQIVEHYHGMKLLCVHSALAYYFDHQAEIDAAIEEEHCYVEEMRNRPEAIAAHERMIEKMKQYLKDHPDELLDNETTMDLRRNLA